MSDPAPSSPQKSRSLPRVPDAASARKPSVKATAAQYTTFAATSRHAECSGDAAKIKAPIAQHASAARATRGPRGARNLPAPETCANRPPEYRLIPSYQAAPQ
jgi:hypothetical protein